MVRLAPGCNRVTTRDEPGHSAALEKRNQPSMTAESEVMACARRYRVETALVCQRDRLANTRQSSIFYCVSASQSTYDGGM